MTSDKNELNRTAPGNTGEFFGQNNQSNQKTNLNASATVAGKQAGTAKDASKTQRKDASKTQHIETTWNEAYGSQRDNKDDGSNFVYRGPVRRTTAYGVGLHEPKPTQPKEENADQIAENVAVDEESEGNDLAFLHNHSLVKAKAEAGEYEFDGPLAMGAESMLFTGQCGGETVVIKSVRSKLNKWLGNAHTRKQEIKLTNAKYSTKTRHIKNEFRTGQVLYSEREMPLVHIYALRKHTFMFLELGYDLIMEYLPGKDLSDQLMVQQLSLEEKISICIQAFRALNFLHRKKLVHLDIKPSNFMYYKGELKLFDFGISTVCGAKPTSIVGTAGYLSPEQIAKETVTEATDLFAMGITLGTLFGGRPLPQKLEELRTSSARAGAKYDLENNSDAALPLMMGLEEMPGFYDILRRCTIYKRAARTQTCQAVMYQLKAWSKSPECNMDIQVEW